MEIMANIKAIGWLLDGFFWVEVGVVIFFWGILSVLYGRLIFWMFFTFDGHERLERNIDVVYKHEFAKTIVEEFAEEELLSAVELAGANNEFWRASELVVANSVNDAKIKEKLVQEAVVYLFIRNAFDRDSDSWAKFVLAKLVEIFNKDACRQSLHFERIKDKFWIFLS